MKKKIDYRHYIAILITLGFLYLSVFVYTDIFIRTKETIRDIYLSLRYYILVLFFTDTDIAVSVTEKSSILTKEYIPIDFETFKKALSLWWERLSNRVNILEYIKSLSDVSLIFSMAITILIMLFICLKMIFSSMIRRKSNEYGVDSKAVKRVKKIENKIKPIKLWIKDLINFCFVRNYKKIWIFIWLYNLNIFTILGETFSYLYYFIACFDVGNLYIQAYKLLVDLSIMFSALPWYIWIVVVWYIVLTYRKKAGLKKLRHHELKNTGFAKSLGIATMFTAPMNGGKTKMVTDLSLTFSSVYKRDCLETMQKLDLEFPNFSFVCLENHIKTLIGKHVIYSLASIDSYFSWKKKYFEYCLRKYKDIWCATPGSILYGYDYERYGLYFDNGIYREYIFDAIITYAKAYFIYSLPNSLIVSNYAIREDGRLEDIGNLPLWDYDYFGRESIDVENNSYYSRILDFDVFRKGKKVQENNPLADTFEFGVVAITEFDKDRGNTLDTKELKKMVDEANQKNDLFNYSPKLARHGSTIDFKPYTRYLFDLQRAMKTEADLREICDCIIEVGDITEGKLAMPLFFIEEFIYGILFSRFKTLYQEYRYYHGNNILLIYVIKKIVSKFINYYNRTYNLYGYDVQNLKVFTGKMDDKPDRHKYYESYHKIHALRYSTDCYSDYLKEGVLRKGKGIIDYPVYSSYLATREELEKQNSYFIRDLDNISNN